MTCSSGKCPLLFVDNPSNCLYLFPMQTAFHILSLVNELKKEIVGGQIVSTEFYKKERAAYIFVKHNKSTNALGFLFHPTGFGTFVVPASKIKVAKREKPWPFFDIVGGTVKDVRQVGFDRIFEIEVEKDTNRQRLIFEAIGPNGNIWLVDDKNKIQATLRKRDIETGDKYKPLSLPDALNPLGITAEQLTLRLHQPDDAPLFQKLQRNIFGLSKTLAREIIKRSGIDDTEKSSDKSVGALVDSIKEIIKLFDYADTGYLYQIKGGIEVYPFKLSSVEQQPEKFKTLSFAILEMTQRRQTIVEEGAEEKSVIEAVRRALKKTEKRIGHIESDLEKAQDFENYKKLGELIQINMSGIKRGMKEIAVADVYADGSKKIVIELDPALAPSDNAENYFKKYRKAREGLEQMQRRLEISKLELENLREMQNALESDYENARHRYESELAELLPKEGAKTETFVRLPYKEYELKSGVKIFVGRDGSDNDRTTFEFAKPYELWFHTQQCAGSHTVLKFPHKSFEPSKREIEETAAIAAYFSKARNDTLVPVAYTQRKYVRKPRKAKPGLVTIEREKSVMVVPKKPED